MSPFRKFLLSLFLIFIVIAAGTAGYSLVEGWPLLDSLYMTLLAVSTVGFREVNPLSRHGVIFTIVFIGISVIVIGFTITTLFSYIFEGQLAKSVKERRMRKILAMIKNHYIICGFGDVGKNTAEEFTRKKIPYLVVDRDMGESDISRYPDINFVTGDATEEEVLEKAKIGKAKGLVACLPDDQQNVFTVLTARQMNRDLHIVSISSSGRTISKLTKAGADRVISPKEIAGRRLAAVSIRPSIVNFLEVLSSGGNEAIRIESIKIVKNSPLIETTIKESNLGQYTGAIIIGVLDSFGNARMNQSSLATLSSLRLREGDELIALGNDEQIASLEVFASGKKAGIAGR